MKRLDEVSLDDLDELDKNCQPKRPVIETDSDDETDDQESQTGPRAEAYPKQVSTLDKSDLLHFFSRL